MNYMIALLVALATIGALGLAAIVVQPVMAGEVNPAHDANNGNGNEKNFGQCKQEAQNDQACIAKK